jgi:hypothetical protein
MNRNNIKKTQKGGVIPTSSAYYSTEKARCTLPTYGVGLIDVAAGGEEEVGDALGAAEGGPVQRDVHLHVCNEGVSALLQQVADHNLVPARGACNTVGLEKVFSVYNNKR